jgi:hypothetical protein
MIFLEVDFTKENFTANLKTVDVDISDIEQI